jgi:iron complex outermembrane receptor protein
VPGGAYEPDLPVFQTRVGGNVDLTPESAVTRTLGLVYSPAALPGFDASLDWYEIEIEDAIADPDLAELLRACADAQVAAACERTTRGPAGDLLLVDGRLLNSGLLAVEGYDLLLRWRGDTPVGTLEIAWDSAYTARYEAEIPRGAAPRSAVGNNVTFEPGFRIRSNLDVAWRRGAWSASAAARWYSGLDEPCIAPSFVGRTDLCSDPGVRHSQDPRFPENRLGSATYVDLQAGWDAPWGSRIAAGVHNVFDRDPPVSYAAFANSFDPAYPIPGRFWYLRVQHAW